MSNFTNRSLGPRVRTLRFSGMKAEPAPVGRIQRSAGHMENGVGLLDALIQYLHGFFRWEDDQLNFAPLSLTFNLIHNRQSSFARTDHQSAAFPRDLLF